MSATVITPTTGKPELRDAIISVKNQSADVQHWIVVDGVQYAESAVKIVEEEQHDRLRIIILPENTGRPAKFYRPYRECFYGHRVYSAIPHVINSEYTLFLDEDNFFDKNHVGTMVKLMKDWNLEWSYSLRKIVDEHGFFLYNDDCDSLGIFPNQDLMTFADMNCYCFRTQFLVENLCPHLHSDIYRTDHMLFRKAVAAVEHTGQFGGSGKYTVNYRISRDEQREWFQTGNETVPKLYTTKPWSVDNGKRS